MKNDNDTVILIETYMDMMKKIEPQDMEAIQTKVKELSELVHNMIIKYRVDREYPTQELHKLEAIHTRLTDILTGDIDTEA